MTSTSAISYLRTRPSSCLSHSHLTSVQIKVHLRTISTNAKHPLAAKECLQAPIPFEVGTCFIQIVHDVVGMFFWLHGPGLLIWNWRTGNMLVVRQLPSMFAALPLAHHPHHQFRSGFDLPPGAWDFAFLSPRAFFVTSTIGDGSIEVFSFDDRQGGEIVPPKHVASLSLPHLAVGRRVANFSTHSSPFLGGDLTENVPFAASQEDRVHVMTLTYGQRNPRFHMFLKNSFLLSLTQHEDASTKQLKKTLSWEEWGPDNTRFFPHNVEFQWLRYAHMHPCS